MTNQQKGYEITFNEESRILKFRGWGFWDSGIIRKFEKEWKEKVREISASDRDWYVLVDLTDFPPQSEEIQKFTYAIMGFEEMKFGTVHNLKKGTGIIGRTLTELQLGRLVKEAGIPDNAVFQSEDEAIQWLNSE